MWKQQPHWQPQVQKDMALKERSAKFNSPPPAKHYVSIIIISISIIIVGMLACFGQHLASIIYVHQRKRQRTATKILDSQLLLRSMFSKLFNAFAKELEENKIYQLGHLLSIFKGSTGQQDMMSTEVSRLTLVFSSDTVKLSICIVFFYPVPY